MNFVINKAECRPNCFVSAFLDIKTKSRKIYEISNRINQYEEIVKELSKKDIIIVGYGNSYYENLLYNFLIENYYVFKSADHKIINSELFFFYKKMISGGDIEEIRFKKFYESIDLKTILFSKENRLSIQEMQASIQFPNISKLNESRESSVDLDSIRKDLALDCVSVAKIFRHSNEYLKIRLWIFKEIGIDCLSLDNVTCGSLILGKSYCSATNQNYAEFRDRKRFFTPVNIRDIVFPFIKFETREFNAALSSLKEFTINRKGEYPSIPIVFKEKKFTLTGGGIHTSEEPKQYIGKYIQADCVSQYPTMIHNHNLLDPTFDKVFLDIYHEAFEQKEIHDKDVFKRTFFKFILNSYYGCLLNEHKPFFCPEIAFKTVINCQLLMLMLVEKLMLNNIEVTSLNTDSVDVILKDGQYDLYCSIVNDWQEISKFKLSYKYAKRVFRKDCNSYIMELEDGTVITKGDYNISDEFGKIHNYYISKVAAVRNILYGDDIEKTIRNHKNIYDFCLFITSPEKGDLYVNDIKLQKNCRYFISNKGKCLYKRFDSKKIELVNNRFNVSFVNEKDDISFESRDINYSFYIMKANNLKFNSQKKINLNYD